MLPEKFYVIVNKTATGSVTENVTQILKDQGLPTDITVSEVQPLDWGTKDKPEIASGYVKVIFTYNT